MKRSISSDHSTIGANILRLLFHENVPEFVQALKAFLDDNDANAKFKIKEILGGEVELITKLNSILPGKRKISIDDEQDDDNHQVLAENSSESSPPLSISGASGSTSPPIIEEKRNFDNTVKGGDYLAKAKNFCEKARDYLCNGEDKLQLMKILHYYSIGSIEKTDMRKMISQLLGNNSKLMNEFDKLIDHYSDAKQSVSEEIKKKKIEQVKLKLKPTGEVSNPSYYCQPASKRCKRGSEFLNNEWMLRTPNVMSKEKKRNEHEKIMIKCEDDRYEFDMALENFRSAYKNVEALKNLVHPIKAEEHLSVHNLRCIEKLYGKYGADILDLLATKPNETLPAILLRLNQKIVEFQNCYDSRLKEQWAKVYAHNLHKSLGFK